jgi:hypothetical protein
LTPEINDMARKRKSPAEKREELRDAIWPHAPDWTWSRKTSDGYATIPRLLPWILHLLKHLAAGSKTGDPSPAYLELWARSFDEGLVTIKDEDECAFAAGYTSNRAARTWSDHMAKLVNLGFILANQDGLHEYGQVLLLHPIAVAAQCHKEGKTPDGWWTSFVRRANDIGAEIPPPLVLPSGVKRVS